MADPERRDMNPKNATYKFKKAWSWPAQVEELIGKQIEGFSLHVCCGDSRLGDVRLDLEKQADIRGDMFHLPFKRETFDTVLCDPPWHLPYHVRHKLLYELRDVLKPGGRLIFNCIWFPKVRGLVVDPQLWVGVPNATWRNASILITARREALSTFS